MYGSIVIIIVLIITLKLFMNNVVIFRQNTLKGLAHLVIWERSEQKYKLLDQFGTCTVNRQGQCTITVHIGRYVHSLQ